jgi:xanthine dehydrogenase iron-sulfur cluster and FAD-binding subunit A
MRLTGCVFPADQQVIGDNHSVDQIGREVADITQVDSDRIAPLTDTRATSEARRLEYRDIVTGDHYEVEIKRQEIIVVRHAPD